MEGKTVIFDDIDAVLGEKEGRFFGTGYGKVSNEIQNIQINCECSSDYFVSDGLPIKIKNGSLGYVTAEGILSYPSNWSKKSDVELKPHLSTIDALNLSVQLNEIFLIHKYNLTDEDRRQMWLRKYSISAGSKPHENLDSFEIWTICIGTESGGHCSNVSYFESKIGALNVYCEIEHGVRDINSNGLVGYYGNSSELLGHTNNRYYGNAYRGSDYDVSRIEINTGNESIKSLINIKRTNLDEITLGLKSAYQPAITMIDSIILGGQISQALLYVTDEVKRNETKTLWMRKVTMSSAEPLLPCTPFLSTTKIVKGKIIKMNDKPWRTADISSIFNGVTCAYSLAYELPERFLSKIKAREKR